MIMHRIAVLLAVVTAIGCTARKPLSPARTPTPAPAEASPSTAPKVASVRVLVTGVLLRRRDGIEICHSDADARCPGIRVEGKVEDAWISEPGKASVWRMSGVYDGTTLVLDAPAQPTTITAQPDYRNSCPEFQQPKKGVNPALSLETTVEAFVSEHAERVAGVWWDREHQTMVVWVTGDPAELKRLAAERAPGARLCVQGQARFSQPELERARAKADAILREHGVVWSGSGGDAVHNDIAYEADVIDAETLAHLKRETGDAIRVVAFIELVEHKLDQLPVAPMRGDVALVTRNSRSLGGMAALGRFTVHYDPERRCVYFGTPDERVLPVWPFGYWATSNPLKVYDFDDNVVAQEGATLELGGGQVDIEHVHADNPCGAKVAWISSS